MPVEEYQLQLDGDVDAQTVADAGLDLFIVEGGPLTDFATSLITEAELAQIQASGCQVVGYVNIAVTDDNRPYWRAEWTDDGTDKGMPTALAPEWLRDQPSNEFGYIVDFSDPEWRQIVIDQAVDLVEQGFDGVYLDDVARYYFDASEGSATGESVTEQARIMMELCVEIDAAIRAVNPNAVLMGNCSPYIVTDPPGGINSAASQAFLAAFDAMLLERYAGISAYDPAALAHAIRFVQPHADLLAAETGGTAYQNLLFRQNMADLGIAAFASATVNYDGPGPIADATGGDDVLKGTLASDRARLYAGDDQFSASLGNDIAYGGAGADTLRGQDGADVLIGGAGGDRLDGGIGGDWADYSTATVKIRADLATPDVNRGDALGDNYVAVEHLRGSKLDDTLNGNDGGNRIEGLAGDDAITGRGGQDTLDGGKGGDTLKGGGGADRFDLASIAAADADVITDFGGNDVIALDGDAFGLAEGGLPTSRFVIGNTAGDANNRLIYNAGNGKLFFDADGNGAQTQILIATFSGDPILGAGDFVVI